MRYNLKMDKKIIIIIAIIIALACFGLFHWYSGRDFILGQRQTTGSLDKEEAKEIETRPEGALLVIDFGNSQKNETEISFQLNQTVFDLTKAGIERLGLIIEYKPSDFGVLVEKINDFKNGQDGKYWMLYINDKPAVLAADKIEAKSGDKIEWKFTKTSF